jgi:adenylate kinase family enzyme
MNQLFDPVTINSKVILFCGSPLSGKGTQCKMLSEKLNIPTISSGDVMREIITNIQNDLSKEIKYYMERGELVPNELVKKVFINKFADPKYFNGLILDGFVREIDNGLLLDEILLTLNLKLSAIVCLNAEKDVLIDRLKQRKQITNRIDDEITIFENRYSIFQQHINDIFKFYSEKQIPIVRINSNQTIHNTQTNIEQQVKSLLLEQYINGDLLKLNNLLANKLVSNVFDNSMNLLSEYICYSLKINEKNKTGLERRFIFLKTTNKYKFNEFVLELNKYGIETLLLNYNIKLSSYDSIYNICINLYPNTRAKLLGIFEEETSLLRYFCKNIEDETKYVSINVNDIEKTNSFNVIKAINYSKLKVYIKNKQSDSIDCLSYANKIAGHIDYSKKSKYDNKIFGWDDIFVMENNGYTFNELKKFGLKLSSRNMNISKWFKSFIHYKKLTDLNFTPVNALRPVDFNSDVYKFVNSHQYFSNPLSVKCGLYNMFINIINKGVFFKSPSNRRIKNYWFPGLNGGIPLVPKSDEIHECTFMAHDFGHFGIPDLIFTGNNSLLHKQVYISWRMMSESFTMCMADMAFVDTLVKLGISYDYGKRKIYNLFADLGLNLDYDDKDIYFINLKKIIWANYKFCLFGDDQPYTNLIINANKLDSVNKLTESHLTHLNEFKEKYIPFFIADYKWTDHNYINMLTKSNEMRLWYAKNKTNIQNLGNLYTIDNIIELLRLNELETNSTQIYDKIFEFIFDTIIIKLFDQATIVSNEVKKTKAFKRYMIGQTAIFYDFYFAQIKYQNSDKTHFDLIQSYLDKDILTDYDIETVRTIYLSYLEKLFEMNLISSDDINTYNEVYPIFNPMYLSYDTEINSLETIKSVSDLILGGSSSDLLTFEKNTANIKLNKFKFFMNKLITLSGGIIDDDLFVSKNGIILLSDLNCDHPDNLVTFLIAGCSIEASMELIAHSEAKVARLTTSKTNAMNEPYYRIFNSLHESNIDTKFQKQLILELNQIRLEWSNMLIPNEIFNMFNMSNKCTALTYSMTLKDFHKLFIGRIGFGGNESEVRQIIKQMIDILHNKYPSIIYSQNEYLQMSNKDKILSDNNYDQYTNHTYLCANTILSNEAKKLFQDININKELPEYLQLAEFRSRITYLTFNNRPISFDDSLIYIKKIIIDHCHLSILSAFQIVKKNNFMNLKNIYETYIKSNDESYNIFSVNFTNILKN